MFGKQRRLSSAYARVRVHTLCLQTSFLIGRPLGIPWYMFKVSGAIIWALQPEGAALSLLRRH